jgi:hypothetical protein
VSSAVFVFADCFFVSSFCNQPFLTGEVDRECLRVGGVWPYAGLAVVTDDRALVRLQQFVYREGHPYFAPGKDKLAASAGSATADELRAFHQARYSGAKAGVAQSLVTAEKFGYEPKYLDEFPAASTP